MSGFVSIEELFKGRHFVVLCIRWYLSFKLGLSRSRGNDGGTRHRLGPHNDSGVGLAVYPGVSEKRWNRFARLVSGSWRLDETYVRVKGEWIYLYRAVDKAGKTVDFYLSRKREVNAAKAFLRKAMRQRLPTKITLDAYAASHRAVADLKQSGELPTRVQNRTSKYLNSLI
jgi:hypothetical protein